MKKVVFISPMYNAQDHLVDLITSVKDQTDENWELIIVDDLSTDDSYEFAKICAGSDKRIKVYKNRKKKWALKNVVERARKFQKKDDVIIAILDADDCLCNEKTVELILNEYKKDDEVDTLWTAHSWDINSMNISSYLPEEPRVNPYQYPWVSSHLKTFKASMLSKISDENFKNLDGEWFKRGYDQALYLPLLFVSRKRVYLNETCYLYRINSKSIKVRHWSEKEQMDTVRLVRARGFVE
mgnify:CR=1 FL=1